MEKRRYLLVLAGFSHCHTLFLLVAIMKSPHRVDPGSKLKLAKAATTAKSFCDDREQAEEEFERLREELAEWQWRLYAEGRRSLLVVLQAPDAGGKDGTVRHVFRNCNPQGIHVVSFKKPSAEEFAHDYLWRIHRRVPPRAHIGVFNRSHYEDVLVPRVEKLISKKQLAARYDQINQFEALLAAEGTTVLKFFLHISKDEQLERFRKRLTNPKKLWKYNPDDMKKRERWEDYYEGYQAMIDQCSTKHAPWYVIPADQKWYRNLAITRVLVATLRKMNPEFPRPEVTVDPATLR